MYHPTKREYLRHLRRDRSWRALNRVVHRRILPAAATCVVSLGILVYVAGVYPDTLPRDVPVTANILVVLAVILLFSVIASSGIRELRRPIEKCFAGRCFTCGRTRTLHVDRCAECGADYGLQDDFVHARRHQAATSQSCRSYAPLIRPALKYAACVCAVGVLTCLPTIIIVEKAPELFTSRARVMILGFASLCLISLGVTTGMIVFRPIMLKALKALGDRCHHCGTPAPTEDHPDLICPKCGASLLLQGRWREDEVKPT
jgi:hypothetical protein